MNGRDYLKAARLAFRLRQPGRLLSVVTHALAAAAAAPDDGGASGHVTLRRLAAVLSPAELSLALTYARDWNASSRTSHCAQALLHAILASHAPEARLCRPTQGP